MLASGLLNQLDGWETCQSAAESDPATRYGSAVSMNARGKDQSPSLQILLPSQSGYSGSKPVESGDEAYSLT